MNKFEECWCIFYAVLFVIRNKSFSWGGGRVFLWHILPSVFWFVSRNIPSSKTSVSMIYSVLSCIINKTTKKNPTNPFIFIKHKILN